MKKRVLYLLCMAFAMMAWLPPQLWAQTQPSGGDGSSESPFLIATAEELKWYASYVNGESGDKVVHNTACAQLVKDIDLSTVCGKGKGSWTPIAKYDIYKAGKEKFDGVFDGNGHTISNLYINNKRGNYLGLFGYIQPTASSTSASVKNLKMNNVQIVGFQNIATVCAWGRNVTFENIEVISGSITGSDFVFGISGCGGSARNCINRANVTASGTYAAGVINHIRGEVSNCSNYGEITTGTSRAGGIACGNQGSDKLTDCANYGSIHVTGSLGSSSGSAVGGLLGDPSNIEISNCANFGNIYLTEQSEIVGVIVGTHQLKKASGILANTGNIYVNNVAQADVPVLQSGITWYIDKVDNTAKCLTPTAEQLASGWLAWQLQQNCSTQTWGQNISSEPKDEYPVIGGSEVYAVGSCINIQFSNVSGVVTHDLRHNNAVSATCSHKGSHEYWYCRDCKTFFKEETCENAYTADADPNTGVWIEIPHTVPANFDKNGLKYCSVCGYVEAEAPTLVADEASKFNGYYAFSKAGHLVWLHNQVQAYDETTQTYPYESIKCYLANDISLKDLCHPADDANGVAEANWNPIGDNNPFKGIFDGNGHCIKNLYSSLCQGGYVGLFGSVYGGTIKNVTVEGVIESSCSNQGMIAGESVGANYYNCVAKGRIITSGNVEYVGGITGWFTPNSASIPVVRGCVSYVDIVSTGTFAGGLIGKSKNSIIMEACANYGNVTGKNNVGGLMGNTDPKTDTRITNCYVGSCEVRATGTETAPNVFLTCFEPSGKLSTFEKVFYSKDAKVFASADATEPEDLATRIAYGAYNTSPAFVGFTAEQVAGGEATYYMNDATTASPVWTQDLSQANSQPELNGDATLHTVYKMGYGHGSTALSFSNKLTDQNTLHPEADNNGSHDEAYRYVSNRHGSKTHSATCSVCGYIVKSQDCTLSMANDICTKCHYGDCSKLTDGEAYTLANGAEVGELNYARNFGGTNWTTWYVPFELKLTPELCQKYAFSRINNVHQYDDDNDGVADRTIVESFNQAEGVTLKANYPYLVRALTDADKKMTITLTEVELANAESKHIDCMSVDHTYTFRYIQ